MAGTVTITEKTVGAIKRVKFVWLSSNPGGAADGTTTKRYDGVVLSAKFVPDGGGTQPSDLYDVTITDADGVDVLAGYGADLNHDAAVDTRSSTLAGGLGIGQVADSALTLAVTNAGAAKGGTIYLDIG